LFFDWTDCNALHDLTDSTDYNMVLAKPRLLGTTKAVVERPPTPSMRPVGGLRWSLFSLILVLYGE
jgi:hypothetical protein